MWMYKFQERKWKPVAILKFTNCLLMSFIFHDPDWKVCKLCTRNSNFVGIKASCASAISGMHYKLSSLIIMFIVNHKKLISCKYVEISQDFKFKCLYAWCIFISCFLFSVFVCHVFFCSHAYVSNQVSQYNIFIFVLFMHKVIVEDESNLWRQFDDVTINTNMADAGSANDDENVHEFQLFLLFFLLRYFHVILCAL